MTEETKHRVLIADDHPIFRAGLAQLLGQSPLLEVVAEAEDGPGALAAVETTKVDIVILDIDLPGMNGLEVAQGLTARDPSPIVILLTMHNNERIFNEAVDLGLKHYVLKDETVNGVQEAIKRALVGEPYVSPSLSRHVLRRRSRMTALLDEHSGLSSLTPVEQIVLKHVAEDQSSKEIAAELGVSPRTVGTHRTNISRKLGLRGPNSLISFALQHKSELLRLPEKS